MDRTRTGPAVDRTGPARSTSGPLPVHFVCGTGRGACRARGGGRCRRLPAAAPGPPARATTSRCMYVCMYVARERKAPRLSSFYLFRAVPLASQHGSAARCGACRRVCLFAFPFVRALMALVHFGPLRSTSGSLRSTSGPLRLRDRPTARSDWTGSGPEVDPGGRQGGPLRSSAGPHLVRSTCSPLRSTAAVTLVLCTNGRARLASASNSEKVIPHKKRSASKSAFAPMQTVFCFKKDSECPSSFPP